MLTRPGCAFDGSFRNANCLHNAQLPTRMWCAHRGLGCDDPRGCGGAWSGLAAGAGTVFARRLLQYVTPCTYGSRRIGSSKHLVSHRGLSWVRQPCLCVTQGFGTAMATSSFKGAPHLLSSSACSPRRPGLARASLLSRTLPQSGAAAACMKQCAMTKWTMMRRRRCSELPCNTHVWCQSLVGLPLVGPVLMTPSHSLAVLVLLPCVVGGDVKTVSAQGVPPTWGGCSDAAMVSSRLPCLCAWPGV